MKRPKHIEYVYDEVTELYVQISGSRRCSLVYASEAHAALLRASLPPPAVCVPSRAALIAEAGKRDVTAIFADVDLLPQIGNELSHLPIVGILNDAPSDTLANTIGSLDALPWLSHVIAVSMLSTPTARSHLGLLIERLTNGPTQDMLGSEGVGRVALLARASRREARFERMHEFFAKQGLSSRTIAAISEVAEELVMNAFYDAPVEAGYFKKAVQRTEDVDLPPDRACEISYGIEGGNVFVRVRDTFGSLTRSRLLEVLNRCNTRTEAGASHGRSTRSPSGRMVVLDESRGGAGLGLWRIFSTASTVAISVVPGRLTDIVIGIATKDGRLVKQLHAVHLFFLSPTNGALDAVVQHDDRDLIDQSITLVLVA